MSNLLTKHNQSILAAQHLIDDHQLYAASVHCSYYSCIQLIKHIMTLRLSSTDLANLERTMQSSGGTHIYLRREMKKKLRRVGATSREANDFDDALKQMKLIRIDADYTNTSISLPDSQKVQNLALKVNQLIKNKFSVV